MGRLLATALAGIALTLGLAACGGSDKPEGQLRQAAINKALCNPPGRTIELHNSGLSCQQAGATLLVLAAGVEGPQVIEEAGGGEWVCRERRGSPGSIRCSQGKRFFRLESVERGKR